MTQREEERAAKDRARLITVLRSTKSATLEELMAQSGMGWAAVFGAVDRLSREGSVVLSRAGIQYRISLEETK